MKTPSLLMCSGGGGPIEYVGTNTADIEVGDMLLLYQWKYGAFNLQTPTTFSGFTSLFSLKITDYDYGGESGGGTVYEGSVGYAMRASWRTATAAEIGKDFGSTSRCVILRSLAGPLTCTVGGSTGSGTFTPAPNTLTRPVMFAYFATNSSTATGIPVIPGADLTEDYVHSDTLVDSNTGTYAYYASVSFATRMTMFRGDYGSKPSMSFSNINTSYVKWLEIHGS